MNKKTLLFELLSIFILSVLVLPFVVLAQDMGGNALSDIIGNARDSLLMVSAALATIAFIVAGIMFLTATGNPQRMTIAKGSLIAGVIGVAIIILSEAACTVISIFFGISSTYCN